MTSRRVLALASLTLLAPLSAEARTVRVVVAVGNAVGDPGEAALKYVGADVDRFISVFVELGEVSPDRVYRIVDQPVPAIRERLSEVAGRVAEITSHGDEAELVLYLSAHAARGELHLQGGHWPLAELRRFVEQSKARLRLLFVDACESGQLIRSKGLHPVPTYDVTLSTFPLSGTVVVSSSGPGEPSQEWDALQGSLFTHYLLTGLRGDADADRDGRVTLAEAYAYTYRRTVSEASWGGQHPALDIDLVGAGDLVLSTLAHGRGTLVFPAPLVGRFVVASAPRPDVVAEIDKRAGAPVRLAVPPGRYLLRRNEGAAVALATVELPFGGESVVEESKFVRRSYAEVTLKGAEWDLEPHALVVGAMVETPPISGTGARWGGSLGYRRTFGQWWLGAELGGAGKGYRGAGVSVSELDLELAADAGYRWFAGPLTLSAGLSGQVVALRQSFVRDDEALLEADGYPRPPVATGLAAAAGVCGALEIPLGARFFALATAHGWAEYLPLDQGASWEPVLRVDAGLGVRF